MFCACASSVMPIFIELIDFDENVILSGYFW